MPTANEEFLDGIIRHQIGLMRLSGGITKKIVELLNESEYDLRKKIEQKLAKLAAGSFDITRSSSIQRLKALETIIREVRGSAFQQVSVEWQTEMTKLTRAEPVFIASVAAAALPVELNFIYPETQRLKALVTTNPFQGKTLKEWTKKIEQDDIDRIVSAVRIGVIQGETTDEISRRVVGSARLKGADGVTQITRQNAEAITRTATNFFANQAKQAFFAENADIIDEELFVATLDARTTPVCRGNDGKRFPLGTGPIPPLHYGCRSMRVAIFDGEVVGDRPFKASTEQQLVREYAEKNGLGDISSRAKLPRGTKTDFDQFARKRVRQLTGTTPASTTYQQFLKTQTAAFQEDVLGKTKALLFRKGNLTLDKFVDRRGKELTLKDLVKQHRQAFVKAGLNPEEFV